MVGEVLGSSGSREIRMSRIMEQQTITEASATPITGAALDTPPLSGVPAWQAVQKLESFIMEWVIDTIYNRRIKWAGDFTEPGNRFEAWRIMHKEYHGSAGNTTLSGLRLLREYPKHERVEGPTARVDGWEDVLDGYGVDLETHSPHMIRSTLVVPIPRSIPRDQDI